MGYQVKPANSVDAVLEILNLVKPVASALPFTRVGGDGDGGYLIPDDLDGIESCFSAGVGNKIEFEEDLAKRGIRSFLADHTVEKPDCSDLLEFDKVGIGAGSGFITVDDWVTGKNVVGDLILQMDIEGGEYDALLGLTNETLQRFRILVVEFHDLDLLFNRHFSGQFRSIASKLHRLFNVVHIHPNNAVRVVKRGAVEIPLVMEFTFHRKDRIKPDSRKLVFPHPLDQDNDPSKKTVVLPSCWRD